MAKILIETYFAVRFRNGGLDTDLYRITSVLHVAAAAAPWLPPAVRGAAP